MSGLRVWIDTDPALGYREEDRPKDVDDAFPIVEAIASDYIELAGISCVFGNSPVDVGVRVASELVELTGADVSVVRGAAAAGDERSGFERNDAVVALADALAEGPLSIAAIGPLTNVAGLIEHFPERAARIQEVVIVAGRSVGQVFSLHGDTSVPDFNFECDPHAGRVLMESDVPVASTGFELTSQVVLTRDDLESLRSRSPVADHLVDGALPWLEWWQGVFPQDGGFHPWDSAALAYLTDPDWFVREPRGWRIRPDPAASERGGPKPWLELGAELPGKRSTYCPGFAPGGARAFVRRILEGIP